MNSLIRPPALSSPRLRPPPLPLLFSLSLLYLLFLSLSLQDICVFDLSHKLTVPLFQQQVSLPSLFRTLTRNQSTGWKDKRYKEYKKTHICLHTYNSFAESHIPEKRVDYTDASFFWDCFVFFHLLLVH